MTLKLWDHLLLVNMIYFSPFFKCLLNRFIINLNFILIADMELVSLSPEGGGSIELMATFLNLLLVTLEVHQDFEAVHAYLGLFLKHHSDTVIENDDLIEALTNLQPVLNQSWSDLKNTLSSAATLVSFAKNSLLTSG